MLLQISVKNYIAIDQAHLQLTPGLICLTGETGAGKSIWIEAISIALGARTDKKIIKAQASYCSISLCFDTTHLESAQTWLQTHDLATATEPTCLIRRQLSAQGRSQYYINDQPCTLRSIKQLAPLLLQINSQHQQHRVHAAAHQLNWLDHHIKAARHSHDLIAQVAQHYHNWQRQLARQQDLLQQQTELQQGAQLREYQYQELQDCDPSADEWEKLQQQRSLLQQQADMISACQHSQDALSQMEPINCLHLIEQARTALQPFTQQNQSRTELVFTKKLQQVHDNLTHAQIEIQEAAHDLQHAIDEINQYDPHELESIEQRLAQLYDLSRKHQIKPSELHLQLQQLTAQNEAYNLIKQQLAEATHSCKQYEAEFMQAAIDLSQARQQKAQQLSLQITTHMQQLAMPHSKCHIDIQSDLQYASCHGIDRLAIKISTNPQQEPRLMSEIASGGELSRIALALAVINAPARSQMSLIFDEIDSGIGGQTAIIVGKLLKKLSSQRQVVCITHLPQVAALADLHLQVQKTIHKSGGVHMHTTSIEQQARVREIARMASGSQPSHKALDYARSLLAENNQQTSPTPAVAKPVAE